MALRFLATILVLLAIGGAAFTALTWRSEIEPVESGEAAEFDEETIAEGARLAAIGNCVDCHTAPDGPAFAGGYPMETPFGVIYGTNITPDPETGIGAWSEEAFVRAMREGVDRAGRHLYPAFPYDQFTRASDEDLGALYAFMMTRDAVRNETPEPEVPFPLGFRPLLAGWKLLFHDDSRFEPDPDRSEEWNHGRYLVDGLAHCGACHTPRNLLGARQEESRYLAGGEAEEWYAPALDASSPAPVPWTRASLARYLRTGLSADHAVAAGPMAPVVRNLARVPAEDVEAIAAYIADVTGAPQAEGEVAEAAPEAMPVADDPALEQGAALFEGACVICHDDTGPLAFAAEVDLARATSLRHDDPRNAIHVVLDGVEQPLAPGEPLMPGFAAALDDAQIAALAAYMRARFTDEPAWDDLENEVARLREVQRDMDAHFGVTAGDEIEEPGE